MSKVVYLDPIGGVSGDMFTAAFIDAGIVTINELQKIVKYIVPDVKLFKKKEVRCGIKGTRLRIVSTEGEEKPSRMHSAEGNHTHYPYKNIKKTIQSSKLAPPIKALTLAIFETLAKAEAKVHGKKIEEIAFHEVGKNDAIADIVCAAYCIKKLGNAKIVSGPIPFGQGIIKFSHGTMPVPAPATLEILRGIPTIPGYPVGEMTTPTGAAIVATCCYDFQPGVTLSPALIGYGHGSRNPKGYPSSFRVIMGEGQNDAS